MRKRISAIAMTHIVAMTALAVTPVYADEPQHKKPKVTCTLIPYSATKASLAIGWDPLKSMEGNGLGYTLRVVDYSTARPTYYYKGLYCDTYAEFHNIPRRLKPYKIKVIVGTTDGGGKEFHLAGDKAVKYVTIPAKDRVQKKKFIKRNSRKKVRKVVKMTPKKTKKVTKKKKR